MPVALVLGRWGGAIRGKSPAMSFRAGAGGEEEEARADDREDCGNVGARGPDHADVLGMPGAGGRGRGRRGRRVEAVVAGPGGGEQSLRRSARIAASVGGVRGGTGEGAGLRRGCGGGRAGGLRIVTGFGGERVGDVVSQEEVRESEALVRAARRREEGIRGRMTGFDGEDLDRGAGGAWRAGRR